MTTEEEQNIINNYSYKAANEDSSPLNDLDYKNKLSSPVAKATFKDINQDMQLACLDNAELQTVRILDEVITNLNFIKEKNKLGDDLLINSFRRQRDVINVTSLSRDGALRSWLHEDKRTFKLDKQKKNSENKSPLGLRFKV